MCLEQRKMNVQRILRDSLGISVRATWSGLNCLLSTDIDKVTLADIVPIDRGYNNYLYTVNVADTSVKPHSRQPGTVPLPANTGTPYSLVVRLLKTELGALPERVPNEVAGLELVRQPLRSIAPVPEVYAWSEGRGPDEIPFIIMELLTGIPLDDLWPDLDLSSRLPVLSQIRDILVTLRSIQIPVPLRPRVVLSSGSITTTVHPNAIGGPFASAEEQWLSMLSTQLREADENIFIKGWKATNLRSRLDSFIREENGFRAILRQVADEPIFVHGDFKCQNLLVSPETHRITGLLDFEFARIGTSPEDVMDGMGDFRKHNCVQPVPDGLDVHLLEINGWPCQTKSESAGLDCQTSKAWRDLVQLPVGYEATAKTYAFLEQVCPWYFCQPPWCERHDMVVERQIVESALSDTLKAWGF
ncbi:kinase-like domain-containing protein [Mycena capillaripes]|nr:kinase-like domain-containing protein [Mycena capillaripes]